MDLVVADKTMVKTDNTIFHDLTPLVSLIEKDPLTLHLKDVAKLIGYKVVIYAGILKRTNQIDEYIHISINDDYGNEVETADGSYLTSYEPVYTHFRNGKFKRIEDYYDETLNCISAMIDALSSGCFLVKGEKVEEGLFLSNFGPVEVRKAYKKNGYYFSIVQMLNIGDLSLFPKVGDSMIINGITVVVSALGYDVF